MKEFLFIRLAAEYAGVSSGTISSWMKSGVLKFDRINRTKVTIAACDVDKAKETMKKLISKNRAALTEGNLNFIREKRKKDDDKD